jgi:hypothetical protein
MRAARMVDEPSRIAGEGRYRDQHRPGDSWPRMHAARMIPMIPAVHHHRITAAPPERHDSSGFVLVT